jgi:hypothetical protein
MIVSMRDARELKYCVKGVKKFFEAHNLDFQGFIKNGIDCKLLTGTGDAMAYRLVDYVRVKNGKL